MPDRSSHLPRAFLLVGVLAAGFAAGYGLQSTSRSPDAAEDSASAAPAPQAPGGAAQGTGHGKKTSATSAYRSTDTLDDLAALHDDELYPRLALWLVDADAGDFEACWRILNAKPELEVRTIDLLFLRWTAVDPHGAIAAASGGKHAHIPWWAWAKNEPRRAFDYAREHQPDQLAAVLRGIGQTEPELAMRLLDEHPELKNSEHHHGILDGLSRHDPEAAVKYHAQLGSYYYSKPLEAWLREDPHAALKWFQENRGIDRHGMVSQNIREALEREHPELLPELAVSLPPGVLRRELEAASFRQLALDDPDAALALARQSPSERIAVDGLSQVALSVLSDDPGRALEIFGEILKKGGDPSHGVRIKTPDGRSSSSGGGVFPTLIQRIADIDPEGAITVAFGNSGWDNTTHNLASYWSRTDPEKFALWAKGTEDPAIRDQALNYAWEGFMQSSDFVSASHFIEDLPADGRGSHLRNFLRRWNRNNPEAAATWFHQAPLTGEERSTLSPIFENP